MTKTPQSYQLFIHIKEDITLKIGKLGYFEFPAGYYVYTGSARRNIEARIRRHLSKNKKLHWHIDYLLQHPAVKILSTQTSELAECVLNQQIEGSVVVEGFGASDCRQWCGSHLKKLKQA